MDEINTMLLEFFFPKVKLTGKTNVIINKKEQPNNNKILLFLWNTLDQGHIHCCKKFEIKELPKELTFFILDFLYHESISISYVNLYWNSIFLEQLTYLQTHVYNFIYYSVYNNVYNETRLYIINRYIKEIEEGKI